MGEFLGSMSELLSLMGESQNSIHLLKIGRKKNRPIPGSVPLFIQLIGHNQVGIVTTLLCLTSFFKQDIFL
ncbi:hypothetical protein [Neobacillus soli]|uniref:hypothetical protein n=1 Tax=Neobacillus soli TaxID=220688 RepID=UPI00082566BF|nr:hypothetical protein [Neobacillus soli]